MSKRQMAWCGVTAALLACAGLGIYFGFAGLSKANELAGVIGLFVALAGLGVAVWGVVATRPGQPAADQTVARSRAAQVNQVGQVSGSMRIGAAAQPAAPPARATAPPDARVPLSPGPPETPAPAAGQGSQSVLDSEVTGSISQIGSVGGDLDIGGSP